MRRTVFERLLVLFATALVCARHLLAPVPCTCHHRPTSSVPLGSSMIHRAVHVWWMALTHVGRSVAEPSRTMVTSGSKCCCGVVRDDWAWVGVLRHPRIGRQRSATSGSQLQAADVSSAAAFERSVALSAAALTLSGRCGCAAATPTRRRDVEGRTTTRGRATRARDTGVATDTRAAGRVLHG
jgi:hypothetical protein